MCGSIFCQDNDDGFSDGNATVVEENDDTILYYI